jgi:hypothetical protein
MRNGVISKGFFTAFFFVVFVLVFSNLGSAAQAPKGHLIGFVYENDGTTPIEGAVIKLKSLDTEQIIESAKSDRAGMFKVEGLESGFYIYGVLTSKGEFNADSVVGIKIREAETAKMSISVNSYPNKEAAVQWAEIYREQRASGEALIGRVESFNGSSRMAEVSVTKGSLAVRDKIHARGEKTDFYQKVSILKMGDASAERVYSGQKALVELKNTAQVGDLVYLVCKKSALPLFLGPLGVATIVAGSAAIVRHTDVDDKHEDVSPFKK